MLQKTDRSENHEKNDFLIERIAFFSDAVFAIAITLMILDIHPPAIQNGDTSSTVWRKIRQEMPEFMGLVISFLLIGVTWLRHHQLFKYMRTYDVRFMIINLCLLFTIILFPFSTSFLFKSLFDNIVTRPQVICYLLVPLLSNIVLYLMFRLVKTKHSLSDPDKAFNDAMFEQALLILSFTCALSWVVIVPMNYHYFGYIFLGTGPLISAMRKSRQKRKTAKP